MASSDTVFSGSIPQLYDHYGEGLLFGPYAADVVRRLSGLTAGRLLETAAGTGIVTRALAGALPAGVEIVATDLNQPMLDYAAAKPDMGRVWFQQADALALPFPDRTFDLIVCQFGIMFFPDRVAGMREARRVLKPGGRFLFSAWDRLADNPLTAAAVFGLAERYPSHPSWFMERTPHGYHLPETIRADLRKAGFADAAIETVRLTGHAADAGSAATMMCQGTPMRGEIEALDPDGLDAATVAAAASVAAQFGDGPLTVPLQALVIETAA
jgi:ubiquinone/menaquinone biosynthesis C-methylase UbiE